MVVVIGFGCVPTVVVLVLVGVAIGAMVVLVLVLVPVLTVMVFVFVGVAIGAVVVLMLVLVSVLTVMVFVLICMGITSSLRATTTHQTCDHRENRNSFHSFAILANGLSVCECRRRFKVRHLPSDYWKSNCATAPIP